MHHLYSIFPPGFVNSAYVLLDGFLLVHIIFFLSLASSSLFGSFLLGLISLFLSSLLGLSSLFISLFLGHSSLVISDFLGGGSLVISDLLGGSGSLVISDLLDGGGSLVISDLLGGGSLLLGLILGSFGLFYGLLSSLILLGFYFVNYFGFINKFRVHTNALHICCNMSRF